MTLLQRLRATYPFIGHSEWRQRKLYDHDPPAQDGAGHLLALAEAVQIFLDSDQAVDAVLDLFVAFKPLEVEV